MSQILKQHDGDSTEQLRIVLLVIVKFNIIFYGLCEAVSASFYSKLHYLLHQKADAFHETLPILLNKLYTKLLIQGNKTVMWSINNSSDDFDLVSYKRIEFVSQLYIILGGLSLALNTLIMLTVFNHHRLRSRKEFIVISGEYRRYCQLNRVNRNIAEVGG